MKTTSFWRSRHLLMAAVLVGCGGTGSKATTRPEADATQTGTGSQGPDAAGSTPSDGLLMRSDASSTSADSGSTQPDASSAKPDSRSITADAGWVSGDAQAFVCTTAAPIPSSGIVEFDLEDNTLTPSWGHLLDGEMILDTTVNTGGILVVGRSNQKLVYLFAAVDPRPYHCAGAPQPGTGDCFGVSTGGTVRVDFPGEFVGSQGYSALIATRFEFYTMSDTVPDTTPVTEEKLPVLMEGATKITDVPGADIAPFLCSNPSP